MKKGPPAMKTFYDTRRVTYYDINALQQELAISQTVNNSISPLPYNVLRIQLKQISVPTQQNHPISNT